MKKFRSFRNKKKHLSSKYILLILTGVCIVALFTSLVFNLSGGPLNSVAGYVFVPMQKGINNAGSWISGKANDFQTLGEVLKENKKLQNQVDDLTNQLNVTKLEQYELDNYRELLDLDDKYSGYQKVAANVIAMDGTNWFSSFTIDKGSKEGIKKGMNVIAGSVSISCKKAFYPGVTLRINSYVYPVNVMTPHSKATISDNEIVMIPL